MFDKIDSQEKIVLAKMANLLKKYSYRVMQENGDGKNLLECVGLSSLANEYYEYLNPFSFNGEWKNENNKFNPGLAINEICNTISSNKKVLGNFLGEFLYRIKEIDPEDLNSFKNYLEVLGYKLNVEEKFGLYGVEYIYSLSPYTEGIIERREDLSYLLSSLNKYDDKLTKYYTEAISTYGNNEYQACISNCRTLIELFFKSCDKETDICNKGILNIVNENSISGPKSKKKIFEYWLETDKGFNRARLFYTTYSLMSGLGVHGEEVPSKSDALLCLRIAEDILIWCFHNIK